MTTVASDYPDYPVYGTAVFTGVEAVAQGTLVHFVGRRRGEGAGQLPPATANLDTSARLSNILWGGLLRGFAVPGSGTSRVISASDISAAELQTAFSRGLNGRGRVEPWAIVLNRESMWRMGMRPVVYTDSASEAELRSALRRSRGEGWDALAVRTEVASGPLRTDWTHEREWRTCFPASAHVASLPIAAAVRAVIVGASQWEPYRVVNAEPDIALTYSPNYRAPRWFWNGQALVHDGMLQVATPMPPQPQG